MSFELSLKSWVTDVPEMTKQVDPSTQKEVWVGTGKTVKEEYPLRINFQAMLRSPGVFADINDVAEAVTLAHMIKDTVDDNVMIDERQVRVLKQCLNTHLEAAKAGRGTFGGPVHEPLILRIVELVRQAKV